MLTDLDREIYLNTDEREEFIDSIEHTALLAACLKEDLKKWKWLILSLHAAVQGACVCALRGHDTAGVSVLTKASGKALWQWLDEDSRQTPAPDAPDQRLAEPWLLLQRVRDPQYLPPPHTLDVDADVAKDLDRLNALRNEFIHFVPKGFSLGVGGMPRIVGRCCDVIERLAGKSRSFRLTTAQRRRCDAALADVRRGVAAWAAAQK